VLVGSGIWSELDQAEGHGGAEIRGDPGLKANRPGSLTRRYGWSSDHNGREAGSRPQGDVEGFGQRRNRKGTGSGSKDGAGQTCGTPETRSARGYS